MNESTRTLSFVGAAVVLAVAAYGMHVATRPVSLQEFSDVGSEFYPDFNEPRDATGLRVAAYNEDAARVDVFNVEVRDGLWRIPSHHNYPADGEDRLADTATSIIGLKREALVSTSPDDHKRLGVLDPLDETITGTEGRGDRITLTKGDEVLADYIIGTKIEDGPENTYHVRRADEDNRTYLVTLDLDISTKFADWIEPDLLDFRRGDIRELVIDRYSIDETRGVVVPGEQNELSRSSQDDPWKLMGLDEATEEVKTSTVNQMINALEDLAIVGVRPKPKGLSANLKGEGSGGIDTLAAMDLEQKGFFIDSRGVLVSNEGDVRLGMSNGVMYVLRFGEVFTGTDVEIEVGRSSSDADEESETDSQESTGDNTESDDTDAAADADSEEEEDDSLKKSRYVFITAQFEDSYVDPLEEKPVQPEPPAGLEEDADTEGVQDGKEEDPPAGDDAAAEESDEKPADGGEDNPPADSDEEKPDPKAEYEKALADYEAELKEWERKESERKEKIEAGQERVQELNRRFADWYYVISAATFDDIRVSREDLVEQKEPEETGDTDSGSADDAVAPPALQPIDEPPPADDNAPAETPEPATKENPQDAPQSEVEPANAEPEKSDQTTEPPASDVPEEQPERSEDDPAPQSPSGL